MGDGLKRANAAARATQPITNAKEAQAQGKVWVEVTIKGGEVPCVPGGDTPIGTMTMKGPMTSEQSFVLWMAAKGLNPVAIAEEVSRYLKGGDPSKPPTLAPLLERLHSVHPDDINLSLAPSLRTLRTAWLDTKTPGL